MNDALLDPSRKDASSPTLARRRIDLLLVSFLILFLELACIRWFGSTVVFLTFFTNVILLATFLGISVGCLTASRSFNLVKLTLPIAALSVVLAYVTSFAYQHWNVSIDVGSQGSPQLIYFGTEYRPTDVSRFVVPMWLVAGGFFALVALMFVGLGQVLGRSFDALPNRLQAYSIDIVGSLLGISAFAICSLYQQTPLVWFSISILILWRFIPRWNWVQLVSQVIILFCVAITAYGLMDRGVTSWSPYYKIHYVPEDASINTNNISHQGMVQIEEAGPAYAMPHLLNRDAGGQAFADVLIIGAGSGNDTAAALRYGASHIDAVEIDPRINQIGREDHLDQPFSATDRVRVHYDDGRSFLKRSDNQKYDLIVYALVDSLVLHSGYSSLRLESFLFTQQAFADAKARLKPGGVFAMYNYYRQGWVIGRLFKMSEQVFGSSPLVISMPYQATITPQDNQKDHITFLLAGNGASPAIDRIRARFLSDQNFWVHASPKFNDDVNAYSTTQPSVADADPNNWRRIGLAEVDTTGIDLLPQDNWPFLYLRDKTIPKLAWQGMAVMGVVSVVIIFAFMPVRRVRPDGHMFFLGAGFMLLETKSVVHMALLFGSTWVVNSIVFFAILVMILLANLFVSVRRPQRIWIWYVLLGAALLVNALVPMNVFLSLPGQWKTITSCAVVFLPIFFAGVIFATSFAGVARPDIAIGSNIAGIILGGLSENFSMMLGFNHLLLVAMGFYALSLLMRRSRSVSSAIPVPGPLPSVA